jgi:putative SOS response-associated peptidase YedK
MLTINADEHPVFNRLHRPSEEKRMVVILEEADYDGWLEAPTARLRDFLKPYPAHLLSAEPAPR